MLVNTISFKNASCGCSVNVFCQVLYQVLAVGPRCWLIPSVSGGVSSWIIRFRGAAPFSLVTGETCRKNEGLVVTGQVSTKTFIFPAVSKHSKSSTSTACHLPKTARHYTPLGTQVPAAHACAIELSFGATTIFSRHSRHISSKTRRIGKTLRKRGHILHRVGMIF